MNRRQFLQSTFTIAKKQVADVPKQTAKIPRNNITSILTNEGKNKIHRRSFLKQVGLLLIKRI